MIFDARKGDRPFLRREEGFLPESGTLPPNYPCTPLELSIRECGTLLETFEFSRTLARMDGLRLGAGLIRQDRAGKKEYGTLLPNSPCTPLDPKLS